MQEAELPRSEAQRLAALRSYEILDTLPEQAYDDITYVASQLCSAPIALVSLIDSDRQWFKSRVGLDVHETPRALAFCAHSILEPESLFVVPDTTRDVRFVDNPLVTSEPNIRFYAGAPLVTSDGHALGTLCVIDREPRQLAEAEADALRALSRQVIAHLELRRTVKALEIVTDDLTDANRSLERRNAQVERSRSELAELCRMLEVQADLIDRDLQRAAVIQRSLLPQAAPHVPDFRVQTLYQPGYSIGGDLYDVVGIDGRYVALVIADAAGHGVSAAMLSVLFKQRLELVDRVSGAPRRPAEVLDELNRSLLSDVSAPGVFVTATVGLLDTREGRLWLASAGHPAAIVVRVDGTIEPVGHTGPALGLYGDASYDEREIPLQGGDGLLLYTDGIFDAAGDYALDVRGAATRLHALRDEKNALETLLEEISDGSDRPDLDDVTLMWVETRSGESHFQEATRSRGVPRDQDEQAASVTYGETSAGTYLGLHGRVTWTHGSRLLGAALDVIEAKRPLMIDLGPCTHLDSTLLGTLHEIVERADAAGVPLRLCGPGPKLVEDFEELSLRSVLEHVGGPPDGVPPETTPLAAPTSDPRVQKLRLLKAHEVLAELSEGHRAELSGVVEALRSELLER